MKTQNPFEREWSVRNLAAHWLLVSVLFLSAGWTGAGATIQAWVQRYDGPGNGYDFGNAVAVDGSGNVFVTGSSDYGGGHADYVTIAYSGAGVPLWTNRYHGPGNGDYVAIAVAVDGSGNVFVTGSSEGNGSSFDYATIAYSGAGVPLWTNRYSGPGNENYVMAMAVDGSGNVFVTGFSDSGGSSIDYATIAYSGAGVPLWTNRYNGPGNSDNFASAVAVDGSGNVFVTGFSDSGDSSDYATIAYSGAGVPLWTNRYNRLGYGSDRAEAVAVDGSGNIFVTGESWSGISYGYATIKYSGAGVPLWTNYYNGPGSNGFFPTAVAVDGSGNVFVTGSPDDSLGSSQDYATIAYSGAGVPLWTNRYNGPGRNRAKAIAVDGSGNVFVTGYSTGSGSGFDYATIAYSGAGVPLWTNRYNGPGNGQDLPVGRHPLALGPDGSVYVTGRSGRDAGVGATYDIATVKYIYVPRLAIERSAADVIISWPSAFDDFILQQNTGGIASMNWSNVTDSIQDNGTTRTLIINPPPTGSRFYRLFKP